jgi:hypothetical protein
VQLVGVVGERAGASVAGRRSVVVEKPVATDALLRALRRAIEGA